MLALLSKKLLVNSIGVLFGLLGKTGSREAIQAAAGYLSTAVYTMYRRLYDADPNKNPDFFSVPPRHFQAGLAEADMKCCEAELADALAAHVKAKGPMPEMTNDALARDYPVLYQSILQVVHNTGERVNAISGGRRKNSPYFLLMKYRPTIQMSRPSTLFAEMGSRYRTKPAMSSDTARKELWTVAAVLTCHPAL